ncbi:MAG: TonB-dependent receptor, partial [Gammaproteobacteria bacterium]|nr:TonB-dependent receptor [Gammaproteobacteria bacterium]
GEYLGLNSINNVPVDVYTNTDMTRLDRPLTEAEMDQIIGEDLSKLDSSITTLSFTLSGDMFELGDNTVQFAAVVEASKKSYEIDLHPRTLDTTGEGWYGRTGTEGKGSRTSYGAGLETLWPITDNLKLTLAGRYDKYDDQTAVDDAWTYNIGLEYRPTDSLLIRSTSSSNFRAPDMHLVYANSGGAFYPGTDVYAITSGSLELEEETGTSHTLGVVYEPMDNLSLSVDLYQLELDGLVEFENPIALRNDFVLCQTDPAFAADYPELCLMVNDRVSFANGIFTVETYPVNTSYQKQRGIDSSMRYRLEAGGAGVFTFTANHTNVLDSEKQPFVGAEVDTNWRNNRFNNDLRSRFRSSVNWELSDWRVTLMSNRLGTISSFDSSERLDSWTTYNLTAGYTFDSNLTLEVIINNLTDEYPRLENTGVWPYFNHQHYNAMGRAWSVEARLEF